MNNSNLSFSKININGWRQFNSVDIEFHDRLTILTGSNGAGKSTILSIVRSYLSIDNEINFIATPNIAGNLTKFSLGNWFENQFGTLFNWKKRETSQQSVVGSIIYSDQTTSNLSLPQANQMQFALSRSNPKKINGTFIGSHRFPPRYEKIVNIPISGIKAEEALKDYISIRKANETINHYFKDGYHKQMSPLGSLKETLISFAMVGVGNKYLTPQPEVEGLFEKFQDILKSILPKEIGFLNLEIHPPEVIVTSSSGSFPIDGSSGGVMSIINSAWQLFLAQETYGNRFVAVIDEPENHLHPSMQRTFLVNIVNTFRDAQFIVATHSPFIISSVEDSFVYALYPETSDASSIHSSAPRSIFSRKLDQLHKAGPASEILRDVLGVPVTMPEWSVKNLDRIANSFVSQEITKETLYQLRQQLKSVGLEEFYADAVRMIIK